MTDRRPQPEGDFKGVEAYSYDFIWSRNNESYSQHMIILIPYVRSSPWEGSFLFSSRNITPNSARITCFNCCNGCTVFW